MPGSVRQTFPIAIAALAFILLDTPRSLVADDPQPGADQVGPVAPGRGGGPTGQTLSVANPEVVASFAASTEAAGADKTQADAATADKSGTDKSSTDKSASDKNILDLDIDQLGKVQSKVPTAFDAEVTTVTANKSSIGKSPAAVFVITPEMIRRSGATSIPECLRMVPGLDVAKVGSSAWAISSRGFNSQFATSLLVLIDGRTVYNPLFGGVFWDVQDVVLQDIERIEVIRGPGATIWGANAVNGVINIITKSAAQTQGLQVTAGGGNQDRSITSIRYGGTIGENTDYRLYLKEVDRAAGFNPQQGSANDAWNQLRGGFRIDSHNPCNTDLLTVQGDLYTGREGFQGAVPLPTPPFVDVPDVAMNVGGGDILGKWTHVVDENNSYFVQTYYDRTQRTTPFLDFKVDTWDIQFQQNLKHAGNRVFTWGTGYRLISDNYPSADAFGSLDPVSRTYDQANAFLQEETPLFRDDVKLVIGSKFMYYFFTGFEYQPGARLLWEIDDKQVLWGAVSRAVRTPVRIEEDAAITIVASQSPPIFTNLLGGHRGLESEQLTAFELGYRRQVNDRLSFELATFLNIYNDLIVAPVIAIVPGIPLVTVNQFQNAQSAQTTGIELNGQWKIHDKWRLTGWYSFLYMQVHGPMGDQVPGNSPQNQAYLMSSWDLPRQLEFDLITRYVENLPTINVPAYAELDARLGWRPNDAWEFSIVGQNLLQNHHLEFVGQTSILSEVNRGVFAQAVWRH